MISAEFEAQVKNGCIELPESLRGQFSDRIRVRITRDEPPVRPTLLDQWLTTPLQVPDFVPLSREDAHERD